MSDVWTLSLFPLGITVLNILAMWNGYSTDVYTAFIFLVNGATLFYTVPKILTKE